MVGGAYPSWPQHCTMGRPCITLTLTLQGKGIGNPGRLAGLLTLLPSLLLCPPAKP